MSRASQARPKKIHEAMRTLYQSGYSLSGLLSVKERLIQLNPICVSLISNCCATTCNKVSKADGAEGDEAVVHSLGVGPALAQLEHNHGPDEEEHCSRQVRHQVDEEAGTLLQ